MDDLLKNPWVWGGGVALIAVIVLFSGASGGQGSAPYYGAIDPNAAALAASNASTGAAYGEALASAQSTNFGTFASALSLMDQNHATMAATISASSAGVANTALASEAMVAASFINGAAATQQTNINAKATVAATRAQADAAKAISSNAMWTSIANGVLGLGATAVKAFG